MLELYCKICAPHLTGNGYCAKHSSSGRAYFDDEIREYSLPPVKSINQFKQEVIHQLEMLVIVENNNDYIAGLNKAIEIIKNK